MEPRLTKGQLVEIERLVALGKSAAEIGEQFGVHKKRIYTAVLRNNLGPWQVSIRPSLPRGKKPMPDWFPEMAARLGNKAIEKEKGVSCATCARWRKENGIPVFVQYPDGARYVRPKAPPKPKMLKAPVLIQPQVQTTRAPAELVDAQSFLQREGYKPVVRCNADRVATQGGTFWICGDVEGALTDAQLIARAAGIRERRERMAQRWAA